MKSILELEDVQLVDVRSEKEYKQEHIVNSQNIELQAFLYLTWIYLRQRLGS
ncbi:MAG: rhodanese-like domain-containing protein [Bacteroidota bacterium]